MSIFVSSFCRGCELAKEPPQGGVTAAAFESDSARRCASPPLQVEGARHRFIQVPGNEDKLRILNMARFADNRRPDLIVACLRAHGHRLLFASRGAWVAVVALCAADLSGIRWVLVSQVVGKEASAGNRTIVFCNTLDSCRAVGAPPCPVARHTRSPHSFIRDEITTTSGETLLSPNSVLTGPSASLPSPPLQSTPCRRAASARCTITAT